MDSVNEHENGRNHDIFASGGATYEYGPYPRLSSGRFMSELDHASYAKRIMMRALSDATGWDADSWESGVDIQLDALRSSGLIIVSSEVVSKTGDNQ